MLFTTLLCGLLVIFAASQQASAQSIPPGSYQKTCENFRTEGANLIASCSAKDKGKFKAPTKPLVDYFECDGDISNNDGEFKCNRNFNSALMQKAKTAIDAGYAEAYGRELTKTDAVYRGWIRQMFSGGMMGQFYSGMTPLGAKIYFNGYVSSPKNNSVRAEIINNAFMDVYNYGASPKDLAYWNAELQKGGIQYPKIVAGESKKLNSDKVIRRLMIFTAYKKTMGKNATEAEIAYWMPKTEYFKQIIDATRSYLYATNGASDLAATVKRHLADKGDDKPSIERVNAAIIKFSNTKAIYDEMK